MKPSHRNLTAYLMDAQQDLTVRNGHVYDTDGHEIPIPESKKQPQELPDDLGLSMDIWY